MTKPICPYPKHSNMALWFAHWAGAPEAVRDEFINDCQSAFATNPASMHGSITSEYHAAIAARNAATATTP